MSRDITTKCNIESNSLNTSSISNTKSLKILNNEADSNNLPQASEQQSLLLSRIKNSTNKVVLQDASTGKSATVHLKKIAKPISEKSLPQLQQIQLLQGAKTTTSTHQGRPQIVYIKSNNLGSSTILRPPASVPNLVPGVIKPLNKLSIIKASVNNHIAKKPVILTPVASTSNNASSNNDIKQPIEAAKNDERLELVKPLPTSTSSVSNPKIIKNSNVLSLSKFQNTTGFSNIISQMQLKGPVLSLKISDGKITTNNISSGNSIEDTKILNLPPLQPIRKEKVSTLNKSNNCAKIENEVGKSSDVGGQSLVSVTQGMTSVLKKHIGSNSKSVDIKSEKTSENTNNIPIDKLSNVVKIKIDKGNPPLTINTETSDRKENDKKIEESQVPPPKLQPRIKKQQLQVKEDVQELCIEVLKPKQRKEIKRKLKGVVKRIEESDEISNDPMRKLIWKDGIGTLDNTNLHFRKNEFGLYDLLSEMEYDALITGRKDSKYYTPLAKRNEIDNVKKSTSADDLYECYTCSSFGPAIEFISPEFCSTVCADIYKDPRNQTEKNNDDDFITYEKRLQIVISDDSDTEHEKNTRYSWMPTSTRGFSWSKYMNFKKTKPAPIKLFKEPFPFLANGFKIGMKLEAIDPRHESYICVMSVVDVKGYRICLHFDSYPNRYDFWINADSNNIFPPGWCERNNHSLHVPKYYTTETFNWSVYLRQCRSIPAPKALFPHLACETVYPLGFRVGMKLEALDKKNSKKMCVATVTDVLVTERFLVHFDGWDDMYDYWADAASPYVHPVGWCKEHNERLLPPADHDDGKPFDWEEYLDHTNSSAVPSRAFKARPITGFQVGMKLEAVDTRVPYLIRVATIAEVKEHSIKISFDGWPPRYSIWVDSDSPDIHPVGWCTKTGHHLEPPLMPEDVQLSLSVGCGVPGCTGQGHVNSQHQSKHFTIRTCPFAPKNLNLNIEKGWDRLTVSEDEEPNSKGSPNCTNIKRRNNSETSCGTITKRSRSISESSNDDSTNAEDSSIISIKSENCNDDSNTCESTTAALENKISQMDSEILVANPLVAMNKDDKLQVRTSVFSPGVLTTTAEIDRQLWLRYTKPLSYVIKKSYRDLDPRLWSSHDVVKFVKNIPNCSSYAHKFEEQNIDGECFVMLTQQDLISYCDLRIGPAIKIYNSIMVLREQMLN